MNLAERLGYGSEERVLLIHADDVGVAHAANLAAFEALERGSITCASILVPCPWFQEVADYCRSHPQADFGVHLTLNNEYGHYRWRPLTSRDVAPSLYDPQGFQWRTTEEACEHVTPEDAEREFRAQIETALAASIDVTHLDTHMGTAPHVKFLARYVALGVEYRLPIMLPWPTPQLLERVGLAGLGPAIDEQFRALEATGIPILDHLIHETGGPSPEAKEAMFKEMFRGLEPGVTHFLVHPAKPSDEMSALTDDADYRARDYELFRDGSMRAYLEGLGVRLIGYREIRDAYRSGAREA
jgi:predicted glycoside hydrolase/deacetylase ChbG (UPF0249 family)